MEIKRSALVLVDISGYTQFVRYHNMALLHAEQIITELLEAVINAARYPLKLAKLEGDAAFLYAVSEGDDAATAHDVAQQLEALFAGFYARAATLAESPICPCDACGQIRQLRLKIIAHFGEVVFKRVQNFDELAGESVITAHRLLKNSVPAKEYVLMTETFYRLLGAQGGQPAETRVERYPDIGDVTVKVFYRETDAPPTLALPRPPSFAERFAQWQRHNRYLWARVTGQPRQGDFDLPNPDEALRRRNWLGRLKWMLGI